VWGSEHDCQNKVEGEVIQERCRKLRNVDLFQPSRQPTTVLNMTSLKESQQCRAEIHQNWFGVLLFSLAQSRPE
jgi:hypothetical protein